MKQIVNAFAQAAVELRASNPNDQLCCVFVRHVLAIAYGADVIDRAPVALWHLWPEAGDPWGAVSASKLVGIGADTSIPQMGQWHVVQGWRGTPVASVGHTFLWFETSNACGLRWDCADKRGPDGGFADTIEDGPAVALTTWEAVVKLYPGGLRLAVLR